MIIINNVNLPLDTDFSDLKEFAAKELRTDISNIKSVSLYRKSVDARKKDSLHFCCSLLTELNKDENRIIKKNKNASYYEYKPYTIPQIKTVPQKRPVVVGFGPAGMFAALILAKSGLCPLVLERGDNADTRAQKVKNFFEGGKLDTESNVQFGEGGAGTFSDGKLNTGIKNTRCRTVLEFLNAFGAPDKILTDAKAHIGTDILINIVKNIRKEIIRLGGEVRFNTKLENINFQNDKITGITANGTNIECNELVLATGHSARDVFSMLKNLNIQMERKPFAMGVRIEHLQEDINKALYGKFWDSEYLGAADYKLAVHLENGRGVYTFCMCPGGEVINASSETDGLAVNGMSESKRNGTNANSAVLVNVNPEDFDGKDVLAGCEMQRKIEKAAFSIANGKVPVTTVGSFCFGETAQIGKIKPTVKPDFVLTDFAQIFPDFITDSLKQGILLFDRKIKGFAEKSAILTAPETRSSSPVRVLRNQELQSVSYKGLYPCGEGAGYAGGIVSAAVDGICIAEKIIEKYTE